MSETHLCGLEGTNPLGFLAALGIQEAFANESEQPLLWWSDDITPHAVVDGKFSVDRIIAQAKKAFAHWKDSFAVNPTRNDGTPMPDGDKLKLQPKDIRTYLYRSRSCKWSKSLATALLAEGSLDNNGKAKPTDLYFSAGNQQFLDTARIILNEVSPNDLEKGINGPWNFASNLPSFGWDITDDRIYALRSINPSSEKKLTNPGPEALAILGISQHPVFAGRDGTDTQGCSGAWKTGYYSWPLWCKPASPRSVKSLLAHAYEFSTTSERRLWYRSYPAWGISTVLKSPIRRSDQGGYGTFGPPEVVWHYTTER